MPSWIEVLIYSAGILCFYFWIGLSFARVVAPSQLAPFIAPALGWAVHSAVAMPALMIAGMSRGAVIVVFAGPAVAALFLFGKARDGFHVNKAPELALIAAFIGAGLLATAVTAGAMPKMSADGVALAAPIFDHSKVAIVDEMSRLGVPPGNPFFATVQNHGRLIYYYLWHFSAAELDKLTDSGGWVADVALTWFTAFASLSLMIGFSVWLSGRGIAGLWVVILAATASTRPVLYWLFGVERAEAFVGYRSGFGGWFFQTSWAPQHVASAMCAASAIYLLVQLSRRPGILLSALLATVMAAGFESSIWVGGIVFPLAAIPVSLALIVNSGAPGRWRIAGSMAISALFTLLLISPLLYDQLQATALRGGAPIAFEPFKVLGADVIVTVGPVANGVAYWFIFLLVEFPAFYIAGLGGLILLLRDRLLAPDHKAITGALIALLAASLLTAWLLLSTLGDNNDLGWRGVLPAVFVLMVSAAAGLARLQPTQRPLKLAAALALVTLGLPDAFLLMRENFIVVPNTTSATFAATPALWEAVRRVAGPTERVANNPDFLQHATPWRANISWALLSNRQSCYAGPSFMGPFTAVSETRQSQIEAQFARIFAGDADAEDIAAFANQYDCNVVVVTPQDGAWAKDPFAANPYYRLVEPGSAWRIYKSAKLALR